MYDSTFTPKGPTVLVSTSVVQVLPTNPNEQAISYRVRCLVTGYLAWGQSEGDALLGPGAPTLTATAPTLVTPSVNTIGMAVGGVETLTLPNAAWCVSSVASGFEVTPGEGV